MRRVPIGVVLSEMNRFRAFQSCWNLSWGFIERMTVCEIIWKGGKGRVQFNSSRENTHIHLSMFVFLLVDYENVLRW